MPDTSRARAYFERFTAANAAKILQALPQSDPKQFEDEQLDFKTPPRNEDIDKLFSKALGAFANNAGGVIVFGIKADTDNVLKLDYAHSLSLVSDCDSLKNRFVERYRTLTEPSIVGVEFVSIPVSDAGEGFLVCYIPEGTQKPYRSVKAPHPYYSRIGCHSVELNHAWLRQLFYPALNTKASLNIRFRKERADVTQEDAIRFTFVLTNTGLQTMKSPCVSVRSQSIIFQRGNSFNLERMPSFLQLASSFHPSMQEVFDVVVLLQNARHKAKIDVLLYQENQEASITTFGFDFNYPEFCDLDNPGTVLDNKLTIQFKHQE